MTTSRSYCSVDGCQSKMPSRTISFFKLPKDEERRMRWIEVIGRPDLLTTLTKPVSHSVCSLHFEKSLIRNIPQLPKDAVPTKCLPNSPITSDGNTDAKCKDVSTQTIESGKRSTPMEYVTTVVCPNCNTEMELAKTEEPLGKARTIIAKVYHFFEREYYTLKKTYADLDLSPLLKFRARTAEATGVTMKMVREILKEEKELIKKLPKPKAKKRKIAQDVPDKIDRSQESSGDDDASSGENYDNNIQTEKQNQEQAEPEPEMETLVVKIETPDDENYIIQAEPESDMLAVHIKPADDHIHKEQAEPDFDKLIMHIEPPDDIHKVQAEPDSDMLAVRIEPVDDHVDNFDNSKLRNLLTGAVDITIQDEVKKEPEEYTFHEPHDQGETLTVEPTTEYTTLIFQPNVNDLSESDAVLERDPIKIEAIEIDEEGFS